MPLSRFWLALVASLAGCVSSSRILVQVDSADARPGAGVIVAVVCPDNGGAGAVTDAAGRAELVLFFDEGAPCVVTAARVGFETVRAADVRACDDADCEPVRLVLEPLP